MKKDEKPPIAKDDPAKEIKVDAYLRSSKEKQEVTWIKGVAEPTTKK